MIHKTVLEKLEFVKILKIIASYSLTDPGKNYIVNIHPFTDKNRIQSEGKLVSDAKEILIKTGSIPLDHIEELSTAISQSKVEGALLNGKAVLGILKLAKQSRLMHQFIKNEADKNSELLNYSTRLFIDKVFEHQLEKIINEQGDVKDSASKQLSDIKKEIKNKRDDLLKSINRIIKNLKEDSIVREDYLTLRDGRMVIPVKVEHKRHLRGFIHSESSTGQTVYIEPEETLELNNDIVSLSFAERREIERLLRELTKKIGEESERLKISLDTLAFIDSIFARAKYSSEVIGSFPLSDNSKPIFIDDARHPLLLKKLSRKDTVPLNIKMDGNLSVVITGPNAGGKTVVLKTIGLLSLMFQAGIHIPVNPDSNFHIFNDILIDIGDEQSIEDDLSTFSSHMRNVFNILSQADENSLVLLDEIGTGTDPAEGSALAAAILKTLLNKKSIVFASTHHGNLKLFAHKTDKMQNAAMQFDHQTLSPTYHFRLGIPGSSYAFEIAKRSGLGDEILNLAQENLETDKHVVEEFLTEIEKKSIELEKQLKELKLENARLDGLSSLYKKSYEKLEKEKKEILKTAKKNADEYLDDVNKKVESVIKSLRESNASRETIKESKQIIAELKSENVIRFSKDEEEPVELKPFKVGDFVKIIDSSTTGKILEIDDQKKNVIILSGSIRMKVKLGNLLHSRENKEEEVRGIYNNFRISDVNYRIDIRGEKPEEAEFEIIRFLDEAYLSGLARVEILHGKGTGVLKKLVSEILKKHEKVSKYYFAPVEQGGEGITIAELL